MKIQSLASIIAKMVAAGMLFGALGRRQFGYYTLLRWVVCGVSAFAAFQASERDKNGWVWVFGIVALFFNPFLPVHLKRETWALIDPSVAVLLLVSVAFTDRQLPPP